MRAASVEADGATVGAIEVGLVVLLGVGANDRPEDGERLAAKVATLRIFEDERGKMARSVADVGGAVLVVPQFTLYGDIRDGRRPDFTRAAPAEVGHRLYDAFCGALRGGGLSVATGSFGAHMVVRLEGDGPVTIVATTDGWAEADL